MVDAVVSLSLADAFVDSGLESVVETVQDVIEAKCVLVRNDVPIEEVDLGLKELAREIYEGHYSSVLPAGWRWFDWSGLFFDEQVTKERFEFVDSVYAYANTDEEE